MKPHSFLVLLVTTASALGAEQFQNLGFDQAVLNITVPVYYSSPESPVGWGPISDLLPGWGLTLDGQPVQWIAYDVNPLGAYFQDLVDEHFADYNRVIYYPYPMPLDSEFSFNLFPPKPAPDLPWLQYDLSQSGEIPADAKSIRFFNYGQPFELRLNGTPIALSYEYFSDEAYPSWPLAHVAGDVSEFAGQVVELRLTTLHHSEGLGDWNYLHGLDSIRFSPEPVPEPTVIWLVAFGAGVLGLGWRLA